MGLFSRISLRLGLPPFRCPNCKERFGAWSKPLHGAQRNRRWECEVCGYRTPNKYDRRAAERDENAGTW